MSNRVNKIISITVAASLVILILFAAFLYIRYPLKYGDEITRAAEESGVERNLIRAVIWTESKYKSSACSSAGAKGLMQLMELTYRWGVEKLRIAEADVFDAETNIRIGTAYLKYLLDKFDTQELALCAYNAGEGRVAEWIEEGKGIVFAETREYIKRVYSARKIYDFMSR